MFSGTAQVSHQVCQFFCQFCVSSCACDCGGWKQGCRLLFASHLGRNVIWKEENFLCPKVRVMIWTLQWTQGSPLFYSFWKVECLELMPLWCQQVNWGNCGIPWANCAVLCVKDNWKGQFWGLRYCKNCAFYSVLPSGMTSQSKIAHLNWECIVRFMNEVSHKPRSLQQSSAVFL
jgi:hypothetical protein